MSTSTKFQSKDGLICYTNFYMGHYNGYVQIPKDSCLYKAHYKNFIFGSFNYENEIFDGSYIDLLCASSTKFPTRRISLVFNVHGGITYSSSGEFLTGEKDTWLLGFDTAHADDTVDIWTEEATKQETLKLADRIFMAISDPFTHIRKID